jgi:hypothetical protein
MDRSERVVILPRLACQRNAEIFGFFLLIHASNKRCCERSLPTCESDVNIPRDFSVGLTAVKGRGRMQLEEVCIYEVKNDKIASEQFFM